MPSAIVLKTYAGAKLNAPPFRFEQARGGGIGEMWQSQPVETEVPGRFPTFVRGQPKSKDFTLRCFLEPAGHGYTMESAEAALYSLFDPAKGPDYLVASDGISLIRLSVLPQKITVDQTGAYTIGFHASNPVWESVDEEPTSAHHIVTSGGTFAAVHRGTSYTYPRFDILPATMKSNSNSWIKRRRIVMVNGSDYPLIDHTSPDGYPLELAQNTFATPGNDLRVILNSREQFRWVSGRKVWSNLEFRARLTATLAANIDANVTSLIVNNPGGFGGWPERGGFFLIDNEAIQFGELTADGAITLTRGALNTSAASHTAGATIRWIQYPFLSFIYDFSAATDPAPPADHKPVIDLGLSTNGMHQWPGPFFNNDDVASRTFERVFADDGPASQRLRQYDGLTLSNKIMVFEDLVAQPGKPTYNNARMQFPVPMKAGPGALVMDYRVDATLELNAYVVDVDGNESRLVYAFNTSGWKTGQSFNTADPITNMRFDARVGAVSGDLDISGVSGPISYFTTSDTIINAVWANPLFNKDALAGPATFPLLTSPVKKYPGIHFALQNETSIDGFVAYLKNGSTTQYYAIYTDDGGKPGKAVSYGTFPGNFSGSDKLVSSTFSPPIDLPSGEYWCMIIGPAGVGAGTGNFGAHSSRTSATTYYGAHALQDIGHAPNATINTGTEVVEIVVPWDQDNLHTNQYSVSPIFGVLSKLTPAQNNSPQQTGNVIWLDAIKATYDSTRLPIVKVQPEESLYLIDAVLKNETTGDSLAIFALVTFGQSITIDCLNRTVTDGETGLPIPFAVVPSNPDDWMFFVPGSNTIRYTETGVVDVGITPHWRRAVN